MLKLTAALLLIVLLSCDPSGRVSNSSGNGWVSLFDGSTTRGWHKYGGEPVGPAWKVKEGYLYLDTSEKKNGQIVGGGDIVTDEEYENFHLQLEWKISPRGNSGIIFYIHEDKKTFEWPWETGPEMQVLDNGTPTRLGQPDSKYYTHRAGDLYDMLASKEMVKPVGEWNQIDLIARNGKLDFYMNGQHTLSTSMWDDNWKKMIAISKFKNMPGFGTYQKGRIGLQDHDNEVCYRNIRIKRL
jgi:hypothetical protein